MLALQTWGWQSDSKKPSGYDHLLVISAIGRQRYSVVTVTLVVRFLLSDSSGLQSQSSTPLYTHTHVYLQKYVTHTHTIAWVHSCTLHIQLSMHACMQAPMDALAHAHTYNHPLGLELQMIVSHPICF